LQEEECAGQQAIGAADGQPLGQAGIWPRVVDDAIGGAIVGRGGGGVVIISGGIVCFSVHFPMR